MKSFNFYVCCELEKAKTFRGTRELKHRHTHFLNTFNRCKQTTNKYVKRDIKVEIKGEIKITCLFGKLSLRQ